MPKVTVKMYATIREAAGVAELKLDVACVSDLMDCLKSVYGARMTKLLDRLESDPDRIVVLVNGMNIGRRDKSLVRLVDGDEVAVFPPVSGG